MAQGEDQQQQQDEPREDNPAPSAPPLSTAVVVAAAAGEKRSLVVQDDRASSRRRLDDEPEGTVAAMDERDWCHDCTGRGCHCFDRLTETRLEEAADQEIVKKKRALLVEVMLLDPSRASEVLSANELWDDAETLILAAHIDPNCLIAASTDTLRRLAMRAVSSSAAVLAKASRATLVRFAVRTVARHFDDCLELKISMALRSPTHARISLSSFGEAAGEAAPTTDNNVDYGPAVEEQGPELEEDTAVATQEDFSAVVGDDDASEHGDGGGGGDDASEHGGGGGGDDAASEHVGGVDDDDDDDHDDEPEEIEEQEVMVMAKQEDEEDHPASSPRRRRSVVQRHKESDIFEEFGVQTASAASKQKLTVFVARSEEELAAARDVLRSEWPTASSLVARIIAADKKYSQTRFVCLADGGAVVSVAAVHMARMLSCTSNEVPESSLLRLRLVCTVKTRRSLGLATSLLRSVLNFASRRGVVRCLVEARGAPFWKKSGFTVVDDAARKRLKTSLQLDLTDRPLVNETTLMQRPCFSMDANRWARPGLLVEALYSSSTVYFDAFVTKIHSETATCDLEYADDETATGMSLSHVRPKNMSSDTPKPRMIGQSASSKKQRKSKKATPP